MKLHILYPDTWARDDVGGLWNDFIRSLNGRLPVAADVKFLSDAGLTDRPNPARAEASYDEFLGLLKLKLFEPIRLLDTSVRHTTLLHECIHLQLISGQLRDRHRETCSRFATVPRSEAGNFALRFRNFPDEYLAECVLQRDYPGHFATRMNDYLGQRRTISLAGEWVQMPVALQPYVLLFEVLNNRLGARLTSEALPKLHEKFAAIQTLFEDELRSSCSTVKAESLLARVDELTNISLKSLSISSACDQMCDEVAALEV